MTIEHIEKKQTGKRREKPAKSSDRKCKKSLKNQAITKKEKELQNKLSESFATTMELKDRLLRMAAEVDNIRKRTEKDILQVTQNANAGLIKDLLPFIDDFERSLKATDRDVDDGFRKGMLMIYQNLMAVLLRYGLEPMKSIGKYFNVETHDALFQVVKKDTLPGIVVDEQGKGYFFNHKVLRHAKVVVSK